MGQNVCEEGDLAKLNFGEYVKLFWGNKGETSSYFRKQRKIIPPPPPNPTSSGKPSKPINLPWRPTLICIRSTVNIQVNDLPLTCLEMDEVYILSQVHATRCLAVVTFAALPV